MRKQCHNKPIFTYCKRGGKQRHRLTSQLPKDAFTPSLKYESNFMMLSDIHSNPTRNFDLVPPIITNF